MRKNIKKLLGITIIFILSQNICYATMNWGQWANNEQKHGLDISIKTINSVKYGQIFSYNGSEYYIPTIDEKFGYLTFMVENANKNLIDQLVSTVALG